MYTTVVHVSIEKACLCCWKYQSHSIINDNIQTKPNLIIYFVMEIVFQLRISRDCRHFNSDDSHPCRIHFINFDGYTGHKRNIARKYCIVWLISFSSHMRSYRMREKGNGGRYRWCNTLLLSTEAFGSLTCLMWNRHTQDINNKLI